MTRLQHNAPQLYSGDRPVRSDFAVTAGLSYRSRRIMTLGFICAAMLGCVYGLWKHFHVEGPHEIPTIQAIGSYKQKPEQPGGLDIPNQDVQVYRAIDGVAAQPDEPATVEHLLPMPEEPSLKSTAPGAFSTPDASKASSAPAAEILTPQTDTASGRDDLAKIEPLLGPDPGPMPTTASMSSAGVAPTSNFVAPLAQPAPAPAPVVAPAPATIAQVKPVRAEPVVTPAVTPKPVAAVTSVVGGKAIQLASMPADGNAASALARKLQGQYQATLGKAQLHTVRADLGSKGIFYRVQSQPLSESDAKNICAALKKQNAGCLIVKP